MLGVQVFLHIYLVNSTQIQYKNNLLQILLQRSSSKKQNLQQRKPKQQQSQQLPPRKLKVLLHLKLNRLQHLQQRLLLYHNKSKQQSHVRFFFSNHPYFVQSAPKTPERSAMINQRKELASVSSEQFPSAPGSPMLGRDPSSM